MAVAFVLSNLTFPLREGSHEQTLQTIRVLKEVGLDVHLFGFVKHNTTLDEEDLHNQTGLRFELPPIRTRLPYAVLGLANYLLPGWLCGRAQRELRARLSGYQAVHLEHLGAAGMVRHLSASKVVVGVIDPGSLRWARFLSASRGLRNRLKAYINLIAHSFLERSILSSGAVVYVVSSSDAAHLRKRFPAATIEHVPVVISQPLNGISGISQQDYDILVYQDLRQAHLRASFCWFVQNVLSQSRKALSSKVLVLGRLKPDEELLNLVGDYKVTFVDWVEDLDGVLKAVSVVAVPDLIGTGIKNRVVQALFAGTATIGTSVAFEGIDVCSDRDAVVSDDPAALGSALDLLLSNEALRVEMGRNGRRAAIQGFDPTIIRARWLSVYRGQLPVQAASSDKMNCTPEHALSVEQSGEENISL